MIDKPILETVSEDHLPNFQVVSATLYRGGQPTMEGFAHLKTLGIKTIINLRDEYDLIETEAMLLEHLGLNYLSIPLSPFTHPGSASIERFLDALSMGEHQPHFVHCQHGMDRTGAFVSIYRLHAHEWTIDQAFEEALQLRIPSPL